MRNGQQNRDGRQKQAGHLTVFTGPMRAKKSGLLIEAIWQSKYMKQNVAAFLHKLSRNDQIKSRMSSTTYPAVKISNAFEIFKHIDKETQVIAIDEAQFFGSEILTVVKLLVNAGKEVVISGLDLNWKGEPFGQMGGLLAMADVVEKTKTVCSVPGCPLVRYATKTTFNPPDAVGTPDVFVGEEDVESKAYPTRCNLHWRFQITNTEKEMIEGLSAEIRRTIRELEESNVQKTGMDLVH